MLNVGYNNRIFKRLDKIYHFFIIMYHLLHYINEILLCLEYYLF